MINQHLLFCDGQSKTAYNCHGAGNGYSREQRGGIARIAAGPGLVAQGHLTGTIGVDVIWCMASTALEIVPL